MHSIVYTKNACMQQVFKHRCMNICNVFQRQQLFCTSNPGDPSSFALVTVPLLILATLCVLAISSLAAGCSLFSYVDCTKFCSSGIRLFMQCAVDLLE